MRFYARGSGSWFFGLFFAGLALVSGCGPAKDSAAKPASTVLEQPVAAGAIQAGAAEADAVAKKLLGADAKVLFSGDLAHNNRTQILVVNPISNSEGDLTAGVAFRRAAALQQNGTMWNEVLFCDEYLKNPDGFLRGTPKQAVSGWTLQLGPASRNGARELHFTPQGDGGQTVHVAWNPKVNRYQSFLANGITTDSASGGKIEQGFLEEMPTIETPTSGLR